MELSTYILAINTTAEAYATNTWMGFEPATPDQVDRIRITLDRHLASAWGRSRLPHDVRIALLRNVFPVSMLTGRPVESTCDLSKAQAAALIDALYGQPAGGLDLHSLLSAAGAWFLKEWSAARQLEAAL
jgi:hypothetical protein